MENDNTASLEDASLASQELTLTEYCIRLSRTDRRVEMIGGFNHSERVAGNVKDTEANFARRYDEFINKPV